MAKRFKKGDAVYFPVKIDEVEYEDRWYDYVVRCNGVPGGKGEFPFCVRDEELKTAEEVAQDVNTERDDALAELKSRNAELEALLKEVMATRDEAIKQNNELIAENEKLKSDCNDWKDTADDRIVDVQNLTAERDNLKADLTTQKEVNEELKAWYEEANKTATEAAEANDDLKAKIADLRNRVGEQLAQIQDLNAEVHFLKEERDLKAKLAQEWHDNAHSTAKGLDELKGRYDELDSVNKEQAEKIRRQDKALADLKKRNDDLQAENTNLTFLLEDAPEKGAARKVHVITNDGKEYMFRKCTKASFDNYNDFTVLKIYEGDTYVAGFLRGDSPANFAAWWTE